MLRDKLLTIFSLLFNQKIGKFPGALPTSVNSNNVHLLSKGYVSALKADGERVFCFLSKNKILFLWRDMRYKTLTLPCQFERCFLFDGELLLKQNLFLIFDVLIYDGEVAYRMDHLQRIELANHFICTKTPMEQQFTYANTIVDGITLPTNYKWGVTWNHNPVSTLRMQVSPRYAVEDCATLWNRRHELPFACDGIIFTRMWCRYRPFTEDVEAILKWKPCITVDFMVMPLEKRKEEEEKEKASLYETCTQVPLDYVTCRDNNNNNTMLLASVNNTMCIFGYCNLEEGMLEACKSQICEFAWQENAWIWQRLRLDKITPNNVVTVLSCLTSIKDRISIESIAAS